MLSPKKSFKPFIYLMLFLNLEMLTAYRQRHCVALMKQNYHKIYFVASVKQAVSWKIWIFFEKESILKGEIQEFLL
jgi:hypothetical protein